MMINSSFRKSLSFPNYFVKGIGSCGYYTFILYSLPCWNIVDCDPESFYSLWVLVNDSDHFIHKYIVFCYI